MCMKKILQTSFAVLGLFAAAAAQAWTYQDGDALLIFREGGFNDVEFDLGSVNQFLNQTNGYTAVVNNFDLSVVTGVFGTDLTGVDVVLVATTSLTNANRVAWFTSVTNNTTAYNVSPSTWQSALWAKINAVGTRPVIYHVAAAGASAYSIDPNGSQRIASYDQIVTDNGVNAAFITKFGGYSPFVVEQTIPGSLYFWGIQPSTVAPKPEDSIVGTFNITADGQLTFIAGPPAPVIQSFAWDGAVSTVSFSTVVGGNYWLAATNTLGEPSSQWPLVSGPLAGTGNIVSLTHTNSDNNGFYNVIRSP